MAANIQSEDGDLGFQIAPMVDVVFVLMLFFLACAGFQHIPVDLPTKLGGQFPGTTINPIDIRVAASGEVFLQDRLIGDAEDLKLDSLRQWLAAAKTNFGTQDPLLISPAPTVKHERLAQVLNAITAVDWKNVSFR